MGTTNVQNFPDVFPLRRLEGPRPTTEQPDADMELLEPGP